MHQYTHDYKIMNTYSSYHALADSYTILKKTSLKVKNNASCAPTINPNTTYSLGVYSSVRYSLKLNIKNIAVFTVPYAINIHWIAWAGIMHSKNMGMKQLNEYPYRQINYHIIRITSGKVSLVLPKNLVTKYSNTGNPNPKEYMIITPYLTSYSLNIYTSFSQL